MPTYDNETVGRQLEFADRSSRLVASGEEGALTMRKILTNEGLDVPTH